MNTDKQHKENEIRSQILSAYERNQGIERFYDCQIERVEAPVVEKQEGDEKAADSKIDGYRVIFSTDDPYTIQYGNFRYEETLSHKESAIDTKRLKTHACVLYNHQRDIVLGKVEKGSFEVKDGKAYCQMKFGTSAKAEEIKKDVDAGILDRFSVGYTVSKFKSEDIRNADGDLEGVKILATRWTPFEISIVTVPADNNCKFVRSVSDDLRKFIENNNEDTKMSEEKKAALEGARVEQDTKLVADTVAGERKRASDIEAVLACATSLPTAEAQNIRREGLAKGQSAGEVADIVAKRMETIGKEAPEQLNPVDKLDLSAKDVGKFSFARAIGLAAGVIKPSEAGFENECSVALQDKRGANVGRRGSNGLPVFTVPYDILTTRVATQGATSAGGAVGNNNRPQSYIEVLRDTSVLLRMGITHIPGLNSNIKIPKKTNKSTFSFKAENTSSGDTDVTIDTVDLELHTASGGMGFSRELILNSNPSIDAICMNDVAQEAALIIDTALIKGSGSGAEPQGLIGTASVGTVTAGAPTWAKVVELMTDIDTQNAPEGGRAYLCTPTVKGMLMTTAKVSGDATFIMGDNGQVAGYPVFTKTRDLDDNMIFGAWSELILGSWNLLDLQRDSATNAASGAIVLRGFVDIDVAVRHAQSFSVLDTTA